MTVKGAPSDMVHVHVIHASLGMAAAFAVLPSRNTVIINSDVMPERRLDEDERRRMIADMLRIFGMRQQRDVA